MTVHQYINFCSLDLWTALKWELIWKVKKNPFALDPLIKFSFFWHKPSRLNNKSTFFAGSSKPGQGGSLVPQFRWFTVVRNCINTFCYVSPIHLLYWFFSELIYQNLIMILVAVWQENCSVMKYSLRWKWLEKNRFWWKRIPEFYAKSHRSRCISLWGGFQSSDSSHVLWPHSLNLLF